MNSCDNESLVAIAIHDSAAKAATDAAVLQAHGIRVSIVGDQLSDVLNYYGTAVRKVELLVLQSQSEAAVRVLAEVKLKNQHLDRIDWVCSKCNEVNAATFDECWSCGKPWSGTEDQAVQTPYVSHKVNHAIDASPVIDAFDESNPYASPQVAEYAIQPHNQEVEAEIRRIRISLISTAVFPPLLAYSYFVLIRLFAQLHMGQITASRQQIRRVYWYLLGESVLVIPLAVFFISLLS